MAIRKSSLQLHVEHKQQQYLASRSVASTSPNYFVPSSNGQQSYSPAIPSDQVEPAVKNVSITNINAPKQENTYKKFTNISTAAASIPSHISQGPNEQVPCNINGFQLSQSTRVSVSAKTAEHLTQMAKVVTVDNQTITAVHQKVTENEMTLDVDGNIEIKQTVLSRYVIIFDELLKDFGDKNAVYKKTCFKSTAGCCCQAYQF